MTLYCIIADRTFDQVCESPESMAAETKDLREMGHRVKVIKCESWEEAYQIEERINS